jgi:hypothetical protein
LAFSMSTGIRERDSGNVRANFISGRTVQPAIAAHPRKTSHTVHRSCGRWTDGSVDE